VELLIQGYLGENNTWKLFSELKGELRYYAPNLYRYYQLLSPDEKTAAGIAEI